MSAIFGIINKKGRATDSAVAGKLQQVMAGRIMHGCNAFAETGVYLWHGKMPVGRLQEKEVLPLQDDKLVILADALLFNRLELLNLLDIKQQDATDTYILLQAYKKWGKACVEHLDGEYAFAIWDTQSRELLLVKDHVGFRPLYYYDGPDEFIFCSEIKAIAAVKSSPNYFDEEILVEYHFRRSDPAKTYNKEIFALGGGDMLCLERDVVKLKKYWEPQPTGKYRFSKDEDSFECLKELISNAVEKRLDTDVPIGITLSGGLDSTSIACILSPLLAKKNKPLYAFSSVLPAGDNGALQDERQYIALVNKYCSNIVQTYVDAADMQPFDHYEAAVRSDNIFPNAFFYMDHAIAAAAREKQVKTIFSGYGGDWGVSWKGDPVIYLLMQQGKVREAWALMRSERKAANQSWPEMWRKEYASYTGLYRRLRNILKRERGIRYQTCLKNELVDTYYNEDVKDGARTPAQQIQKWLGTGRVSGMAGAFCSMYQYYQMTAAFPLFDKDINEFLLDAPLYLYRQGGYKRSLMRNAMNGIIPQEIQWRQDKLPYVPGYRSHIMNCSAVTKQIAGTPGSAIVELYIDKTRLHDYFMQNGLENHRAPEGFDIRIMQSLIVCSGLQSLYDTKNYKFVK